MYPVSLNAAASNTDSCWVDETVIRHTRYLSRCRPAPRRNFPGTDRWRTVREHCALHCVVNPDKMNIYNPNKQGQVINRRNICPHCRLQQAPQARTNLPQSSCTRVQKRAWGQLCTRATKQDANSSAEDLTKDSRAEARRRRRETRQTVEPLVDKGSPVDIDPVSQLTSLFDIFSSFAWL